ncbi:MAG TPA: DnaJ domain-containing protein [Spirochaetota bacterium]|nr:DnaJ domain-containing protein [Spirochaetota bacterium]
MGKLLGLFFGFLVFGPIGSFIGLIFGFIFDANVKVFNYNFFAEDSGVENELLMKSFPALCAEIVLSYGIDKNSVFIVKNLSIEIFGKKAAIELMESFKNYVENGYSTDRLQSLCEELRYGVDSNTKVNLINILFKIIKFRGFYSKSEVDALKRIAQYMGMNINPFGNSNYNENFYGYYENSDGYYQNQNIYNYTTAKDYYKVLEIDNSASDDDIKKQYRNLCKKYHPDIVNNLPEKDKKASEEKMKEIIDAYEEIKKERGIK